MNPSTVWSYVQAHITVPISVLLGGTGAGGVIRALGDRDRAIGQRDKSRDEGRATVIRALGDRERAIGSRDKSRAEGRATVIRAQADLLRALRPVLTEQALPARPDLRVVREDQAA